MKAKFVYESIKWLTPRSPEELKKSHQEENELKPDGVLQLTNTGGIEVKLVDGGDEILYRFFSEDPFAPYTEAEIEWGYDKDDFEEDEEGNPEYRAYFLVGDTRYYLDEFMRIR